MVPVSQRFSISSPYSSPHLSLIFANLNSDTKLMSFSTEFAISVVPYLSQFLLIFITKLIFHAAHNQISWYPTIYLHRNTKQSNSCINRALIFFFQTLNNLLSCLTMISPVLKHLQQFRLAQWFPTFITFKVFKNSSSIISLILLLSLLRKLTLNFPIVSRI